MKNVTYLLRCSLLLIVTVLAFGCKKALEKSGSTVTPPQSKELLRVRQVLAKFPIRLTNDAKTVKITTIKGQRVRGAKADLDVFVRDDGYGACWQGLTVDKGGNVYPIGLGNFWKITPDGRVVNNESNLFATVPYAVTYFGIIDEKNNRLVSATAPLSTGLFSEGTVLQPTIEGFTTPNGIAVGSGPLNHKLVVADVDLSGVPGIKVVNKDNTVSQLSNVPMSYPEAVAVASNGTVYTVDIGVSPAILYKTTPKGTTTVFATTEDYGIRGLAVDNAGRVYWTRSTGVVVYSRQGKELYTLPGPADQEFGNPMGMQFDRTGKLLYIVDNYGCREIYRYSLK
jgi:sugar lactone lactonase YvrE